MSAAQGKPTIFTQKLVVGTQEAQVIRHGCRVLPLIHAEADTRRSIYHDPHTIDRANKRVEG